MAETGSYNVNRRRKDASYKNFICALMAFLAMLILISILLWALRNRGSGSESLISNTTTPTPTEEPAQKLAYSNEPTKDERIKDEKTKNVTTSTEKVTSGVVKEKETTVKTAEEQETSPPKTENLSGLNTTLASKISDKLLSTTPTSITNTVETTQSKATVASTSSTAIEETTPETVAVDKKFTNATDKPAETTTVKSADKPTAVTSSITKNAKYVVVVANSTETSSTTKGYSSTTSTATETTVETNDDTTTTETTVESPEADTTFKKTTTTTTIIPVVSSTVEISTTDKPTAVTSSSETLITKNAKYVVVVANSTETSSSTTKGYSSTTSTATETTVETKDDTTITETNVETTDADTTFKNTTTTLKPTTIIPVVSSTVEISTTPTTTVAQTTVKTTAKITTTEAETTVKQSTAKTTTEAETTVKQSATTTTTESTPQEFDDSSSYTTTTEVITTVSKNNLVPSSSQASTTVASQTPASTGSSQPVSSTTVSTAPATTPFIPTKLVATTVQPTKGNSVPTCQEGVCKRAASVMLGMMNHEDNPKVCDDDTQNMDYFSIICDKPEESKNAKFFKASFRNFYKKLKESTEDSVKFFVDFYDSCNKFENSVHRLNRTKALTGTGGADVTETVVKSILAESMPFFDLGLNIIEDEFVFEISLPGVNYLKTKVKGWSLVEQLKDFCIAAEAGTISQDVIELNERSENINSCIKEMTSNYVNDFLAEIKELTASLSSGKDHLAAIEKSGEFSNDLLTILNDIQDSWKVYRSDKDPSQKRKLMTLAELKGKYALGFDWTDVLSKVSTSTITDATKVYFSEYLDKPFQTLVSKTANIKDMLDVWYSVQMYKNVVMEKQTGNLGYYCMQLTSELIPEISASIIYELNHGKETEELYSLTETLLDDLKTRFKDSLEEANFSPDSYRILEDRLNQMQLEKPESISLSGLSFAQINGVYQDQLYQLMEHYKKAIYNQVKQPVTPEILLKLFVGAFDTEPKTYPPNREIVYQPGFVYDMKKNIPYYVRVAKHGFALAEQIAKQFIKNDFTDTALASEEIKLYQDLYDKLDTKYLLDRSSYTIENVKCQVEDDSGHNLKYETIVGDNLAFRLATDTFLKDPSKEILPFLTDYTKGKTFIISALQDFCKPNNVADFIGDFYNVETIPAPLRIRNIAKNSQFFADTFNCKDNFERKQFPFLK